VRNEFVIRAVLGNLLIAAMEIADLRDCGEHGFPVELDEQTQHTVRRRMLGTHVQHHGVIQRIGDQYRRVLIFKRGQNLAPPGFFK
jgi:hypothetical protein